MADEEMHDDFGGFDFSVPEEVPPEDGEASRFHAAQAAELAEIEDELVIPNLIEEIVTSDEKCWLGLLLIHQDDKKRPIYANVPYTRVWVDSVLVGIYPEAVYNKSFDRLDVGLLGRACATAISNCTYTNDGGKAHYAMQAKAICRDGLWVVDSVPRNKQVLAITSQHAVDVQLFCCSVALATEKTVERRDKINYKVTKPALVEKNTSQKEILPVEVKRLFKGLLQFKKGVPVTADTIGAAPFLWKAVYETVKAIEIPLDGLPMPLVYFKWINLNFGYMPKVCSLRDVYYSPYPPILKELSHTIAAHSVLVGGVFLNSHHFENEGLKHCHCKRIGGEFATDLCFYNTNTGVIWEAAGAKIENATSGLKTKVEAVRNASDFDGVWWNPRGQPEFYSAAIGFVIPYDKNGKGLTFVKSWAALKQNQYKWYRIWCHYGSMPALWVEQIPEFEPFATMFNPHAVDILWKVMSVMGIYNMQASLNSNWILSQALGNAERAATAKTGMQAKHVPTVPVFCTIVNGKYAEDYQGTLYQGKKVTKFTEQVPSLFTDFCMPDWLPGRWTVNLNVRSQADNLKRGFGAYNNYANFARAAHEGFSGASTVPEDGDSELPKFTGSSVFTRNMYKKAKHD